MLFVFYILLLVVFSLLSPFFMTTRNMMAIGSNIAFIGLMAAAGTPLIIAGGLDLSVAAIAGLVGVLIAVLNGAGLNIWLAAVLAVLLGGVDRRGQRPVLHPAPAQPADRHPRHDEHRLGRRADPHRRPHQAADGAGLQLDRLRAASSTSRSRRS